jgi:hypothetical protein
LVVNGKHVLTPFERGLIAHLIADWLLQNEWIAQRKRRLTHPAAWLHGLIHVILLGVALGWAAGLTLGALHILVDTSGPLNWWQRVFKKTNDGPIALHVAIWSDQVLHVLGIGLWLALARM